MSSRPSAVLRRPIEGLVRPLLLAGHLVIAVAAPSTAHGDGHAGCDLTKLVMRSPTASATAHSGEADGIRVTLANPDQPDQPTAWEGPVTIQALGSGRSCEYQSKLVTDVHVSRRANLVALKSYSLPSEYVEFVDVATCQKKWPDIESTAAPVSFDDDRITFPAGCECVPKDAAICTCWSAKVFELGSDCKPKDLREASLALTKSVVGVPFEGRRQVRKPKSPSAELLP